MTTHHKPCRLYHDIPPGTVTVFQIARELNMSEHATHEMLRRAGIRAVGMTSVRGWGANPWRLYSERAVAVFLSEREEQRAEKRVWHCMEGQQP